MSLSSRHVLLWAMLALAVWTAQEFLLPLAFGVILAVALWPLNRRWAGSGNRLRRRLVVPLAITLATSLMFILPLTAALLEAAVQGQALLDWLGKAQSTGMPPPDWLANVPLVGRRAVLWWHEHLLRPGSLASGATESALGTVAQWTLAMGSQIASRSLLLLVGLMALFCILRDGEMLEAHVRRFARLELGAFGDRFLDQMVFAVRGTVVGTIAVAIGEGVLIGAGYAVAGRAAPAVLRAADRGVRDAAVRRVGGVQRGLADPRGARRAAVGSLALRLWRRGHGDRRQPGHPVPGRRAAAPAAAVRLRRRCSAGSRRSGWSGSSSARW